MKFQIRDIKRAADLINEFIGEMDEDQFKQDLKTISSVCYQMSIIGEAANKLTSSYREQFAKVPWRQVIGMRNHLIHAYHDVNTGIIWRAAKIDVPGLLKELGL